MVIPLAIIYYLYLAAVLFFLLFSFFTVYPLIRYGYLNLWVLILILVYVGGMIGILVISWHYVGQIDWHQNIEMLPAFSTKTL